MDFLLLAVVVLAAFAIAKSARIVPSSQAWIVERLGRYRRTLHPGFHLTLPLFDRVAFRHSLELQQRRAVHDLTTAEERTVPVAIEWSFRVLDERRASYEVADLETFVERLLEAAAKRSVEKRPESDLREATREIEADVQREAAPQLETVGVALVDVSIAAHRRE
ncbi:MAG TPA: SPFH domain-containing protein [Thermoanaerobaculia bacterium]|nr:SPFH domain-containing protein [Thermoanaerobaculia bacterium]